MNVFSVHYSPQDSFLLPLLRNTNTFFTISKYLTMLFKQLQNQQKRGIHAKSTKVKLPQNLITRSFGKHGCYFPAFEYNEAVLIISEGLPGERDFIRKSRLYYRKYKWNINPMIQYPLLYFNGYYSGISQVGSNTFKSVPFLLLYGSKWIIYLLILKSNRFFFHNRHIS